MQRNRHQLRSSQCSVQHPYCICKRSRRMLRVKELVDSQETGDHMSQHQRSEPCSFLRFMLIAEMLSVRDQQHKL